MEGLERTKTFVAQMMDEIRHANLPLGQMEVSWRVLPAEEKRDVMSAKEFVWLLSYRHFLPLLSRRRNEAEFCYYHRKSLILTSSPPTFYKALNTRPSKSRS